MHIEKTNSDTAAKNRAYPGSPCMYPLAKIATSKLTPVTMASIMAEIASARRSMRT